MPSLFERLSDPAYRSSLADTLATSYGAGPDNLGIPDNDPTQIPSPGGAAPVQQRQTIPVNPALQQGQPSAVDQSLQAYNQVNQVGSTVNQLGSMISPNAGTVNTFTDAAKALGNGEIPQFDWTAMAKNALGMGEGAGAGTTAAATETASAAAPAMNLAAGQAATAMAPEAAAALTTEAGVGQAIGTAAATEAAAAGAGAAATGAATGAAAGGAGAAATTAALASNPIGWVVGGLAALYMLTKD